MILVWVIGAGSLLPVPARAADGCLVLLCFAAPSTSIALLALSGCASIVSGHNQSVSVVTKQDGAEVTGAKCSLWNDKGQWFATSPGSVTVRRSYLALSVDCKTDVATGFQQVKSSTKAMAFGNILFGGVIGVGVDVATGAAYDYPELISMSMVGMPGTSAPTVESVAASSFVLPAPSAAPVVPAAMPVPVPELVVVAAAPAPTGPVTQAASPTKAQPLTSKPRALVGQDEFQARRVALDLQCHPSPSPVLIGKAPASETYTVACSDGQAIAVRCDYGACRVLK